MSAASIIPLFSTSASLKSGGIFTVEKAGVAAKAGHTKGPLSLCDLAKAEKLTRLHLVESNFVQFMTAHKNLKEVGCDLAFGLKLTVCDDMADKSEASLRNESRVVIWLAADAGYQPLIKLYSKAAIDGFYYAPRIDWRTLRSMWSEHLLLALPFYSSFLARNTLTFASIVPGLPCREHLVFREAGQQLPFDELLDRAVDGYLAATPGAQEQRVKSVYYGNRRDAKAWMVWQCALKRSSWDKPNLDHCHSAEFCLESLKEVTT